MSLVPESTLSRRDLVPGKNGRRGILPHPHHRSMHHLQKNDEEKDNHIVFSQEIQHKTRFRPLVVMFIGRRGGGKSAAMSATAWMQHNRYKRAGFNFHVVSNYKLGFAAHSDPYLVDDLMNFPEWAENLFICIDEAAASFPSRRSMAGANVTFSNFLTQIRKRRCEVVFTTQFPQVMDVQILLQVDLFIRCRTFNGNKSIELQCYDWWGQWTGNDYRKPWPPESGMQDWTKYYHHVDRIWNLYDTSEVVSAMWSKQRDQIIQREGWEFLPDEDEQAGQASQEESERLVTAQSVPEDITQLLMQAGPSFSLLAYLEHARLLDSRIKTRADFADYLESQGYLVHRTGPWVAQRKAREVSAEKMEPELVGV